MFHAEVLVAGGTGAPDNSGDFETAGALKVMNDWG